MSKILATGTLVDVSQSDVVAVPELHTGGLGVLLSGTFGATGRVVFQSGTLSPLSVTKNIDPADNSKHNIQWEESGLFYVPHIYDHLALVLILGTDAVTSINYTLFIRARP